MAWKKVGGVPTKVVTVKEPVAVGSAVPREVKIRLPVAPWDRPLRKTDEPEPEGWRKGGQVQGKAASPWHW